MLLIEGRSVPALYNITYFQKHSANNGDDRFPMSEAGHAAGGSGGGHMCEKKVAFFVFFYMSRLMSESRLHT